eukprot:3916867-Pyramimonas_sp.AAC.1
MFVFAVPAHSGGPSSPRLNPTRNAGSVGGRNIASGGWRRSNMFSSRFHLASIAQAIPPAATRRPRRQLRRARRPPRRPREGPGLARAPSRSSIILRMRCLNRIPPVAASVVSWPAPPVHLRCPRLPLIVAPFSSSPAL